ncbi:MAG: hypothetical protein KGL94_12860, partial [Acidobacteriota bacterium]|nr:hypothetical protein [Acidobacteriota bacterium]
MGEMLARMSGPRRLEATALVVYALVFILLFAFGRPGLGISQGFYLAIVLVALAGGPVSGIGAGVLATLLWGIAAAHNGSAVTASLEPLAIRLASYSAAGAAVGYFAHRGRQMLAESLHVLDELLRVARREVATGTITAEGIHARIVKRAEESSPFAVLVGTTAETSEVTMRRAMRALAAAAGPESEIARVGRTRVAVVVPAETADEAQRAA